MTSIKNNLPVNLSTTDQGLSQTTSNMTGAQKFRSFLGSATQSLASLAGAIPIPGGAVVSAALSGISSNLAQAGGTGAFGGAALPIGQGYGGGGFGGGGSGFGAGSIGGGGGGGGAGGIAGGILNGIAGMLGGGGGGGSAAQNLGNPEAQMQQMMQQNMHMMQIQQQVQQQSQQFAMLSNLIKVGGDMGKQAIDNIH